MQVTREHRITLQESAVLLATGIHRIGELGNKPERNSKSGLHEQLKCYSLH